MPDYNKGKIYKLTGAGKIYIGSTTQLLSARHWAHKNQGATTVQEIITDPNNQITLIELFPCSSKEELLARERYHIENTECINKKCPLRTATEKKEIQKKNNAKLEHIEKLKLYRQTDEFKKWNREYSKKYSELESRKQYLHDYNRTEEYREKSRIKMRERRARKKLEAQQSEVEL